MLKTLLLTLLLYVPVLGAASPQKPFRITVVDHATQRGIPLVELRLVNDVRFVTDSAGVVAFDEPGLLDQPVFFHVSSPGYDLPADGFGYRGMRLQVTPGGSATIEMDRQNIAERLYRVTGGGIYRDSVLLGDDPPLEQPVLNAQVFGSDSVQSAVYRGLIHWFWGDTNRPSYPLGNFHTPGAVSMLPGKGGLSPGVGVNLQYFVGEDGFAKSTAKLPGDGPTWIDALTVLKDTDGSERMFATYAKIEPPLHVYERGLIEFNDETQQFDRLPTFPVDARLFPAGHTFQHEDEEGISWVYFANPYPYVRVRATVEAFQDLSKYETWTYVTNDSTSTLQKLDQGPGRHANTMWRRGGVPVNTQVERDILQLTRQLPDEDYLYGLKDRETGRAINAHRGSVAWNEYRHRWIMIFTEVEGTASHLGEVWFAEAESMTGPWAEATHIATHPNYSFYNSRHHPFLDEEGGRVIYFEGTYTATFSGNKNPTPRYDYNQIMYRLDLSDERLPLRE